MFKKFSLDSSDKLYILTSVRLKLLELFVSN